MNKEIITYIYIDMSFKIDECIHVFDIRINRTQFKRNVIE